LIAANLLRLALISSLMPFLSPIGALLIKPLAQKIRGLGCPQEFSFQPNKKILDKHYDAGLYKEAFDM